MAHQDVRNPLHQIAIESSSSVEEFNSLLDQSCDDIDSRTLPDSVYRQTALHFAMLSNSEPKVRWWLDRGASVNLPDSDGNTALHLALRLKNKELVQLLLEKGADLYGKNKDGNTPLHESVWFESGLQTLLTAGVDPNIKNDSGSTPLDIAVFTQSESVLNTLLAAGCDPNIKGYNGQTPLHLAVSIYFELGVKTLLAAGVDPNIRNGKGRTPLMDILGHPGTASTSSSMITELLAWGATVEIEKENSLTPSEFFRLYPVQTLLFSEHFTKIECANLNMDIEKQDYYVQDCFLSFQTSCLEELEKMKANKFGRFSLYDIFAKYNDPLYCLSEGLEEATKPNYSALDSEFPLYAPFLRARFFKAKQRLLLLNEAQSRVPFQVPDEIKRIILSFLDSKDLGNVVKAFGGPIKEPSCCHNVINSDC